MVNEFLPFASVNDYDLISLLDNTEHCIPLHVLDELKYDPFKYYDNESNLSIECNLNRLDCNYNFCENLFQYNSCLTLLAVNISSLPQHFDSFFDQCVNATSLKFDVIGFCETRLNDTICSLYSSAGYSSYHNNKNTQGGGISIYLNELFQANKLNHLCFQLPYLESLFLEIVQPNKFIIGMIYRPPNSNIDDFFTSLTSIMNMLTDSTTPVYIMGDFNINILHSTEKNAQTLVNLFHSYLFMSVINKPTRVIRTSATIIDHIWTNNVDNYLTSGVIYSSISDHFPIFGSFSVANNNSSNTITFSSRKITDEAMQAFKEELRIIDWNDTINYNADKMYDKFISQFSELYNKYFPLSVVKIKEKHIGKPYITAEIKELIKQRNKLQKLYARWPLTYEKTFKSFRNHVTSVIKLAKKNYHNSFFQDNARDPKRTWRFINNILGKGKQKLPSSFIFNNNTVSDKYIIVNLFNKYFSTIGNNLASNNHDRQASYATYLSEPVPYSFYLKPTTVDEIKSVILQMKISSPGHDGINIKVIKECHHIISPVLSAIINKSFIEGFFPDDLKIARITPVFKKGNRSLPENYRPISILPSFSKVFEKVMVKRLMDYFSKYSILTPYQYGFRPNSSTELAVHHLSQNIYNAIDSKMFQITVFCDFSKAFDTISHNILLNKLFNYGIRGNAHNWIKSYLTNRKQYSMYNNVSSPFTTLMCGVPQGSILGPLLFLVYINDIVRSSTKLKFLLYADDTTLFIQGNNLANISQTMNIELDKVHNWIISNELTLNTNKTQYIISSPLMANVSNTVVKINNFKINEVNECKFLGIIINNKLKWSSHINLLQSKISILTGIMYRIRNYVNMDCLRQIYQTLIHPHLLYCTAIWGGAYKTYLDSLFITQKKLMRIMSFKNRYDHTNDIYRDLRVLKLPDILYLQTMIFVHKSIHSIPVEPGFTLMPTNNTTRRPHNLRVPLCRTSHAQHSIISRGSVIWNDLPGDLAADVHIGSFKKKIANKLFDKYN